MTNIQATALRTGATAAITALAVMFTLYPHYIWIPAVITAASTVGIHAIPSIQQNALTVISTVKSAATTGKVTTMSEPIPENAPSMNTNVTPTTEIERVVDGVAEAVEVLAPELTDPLGDEGAQLMGLTPAPVPAPVAATEGTVAATSTVAPVSVTTVSPTSVEPVSQPAVTTQSKVKGLIGDAIDALKRVADAME